MRAGRSVSVLGLALCPIRPTDLSPYSAQRHKGRQRWGTPLRTKPSRSPCRSQRELPGISLEVEERITLPRIQNREIKVPAFRKRLYKQLSRCRFSTEAERFWAKEFVAHQSTRESRQRRSEEVCMRSRDASVGVEDWLLL